MTDTSAPHPSVPHARLAGYAGAILVAAAALYLTLLPAGNAPERARSAKLAELAKGEIAALQVRSAPQDMPALAFKRPDGSPVSLADFKGRFILLNLWATWCAPCKKEMPALDRLQKELGGADFEVVAINIDTRNTERANDFLDDIGVKTLTRYADHSAAIFQDLKRAGKATGMPTTILIDPQGREIANLAGPAEWASADALAFLKMALGR